MSAAGRPWPAGAAPPPRLGPPQAAGTAGSGGSAASGRMVPPGRGRWLSDIRGGISTVIVVVSAGLSVPPSRV